MAIVHTMVGDQGKVLEQAEQNVDVAADSVVAAVEDIEITDDLQRSRRCKIAVLICICLSVLIAIVIALLVLHFVEKKF